MRMSLQKPSETINKHGYFLVKGERVDGDGKKVTLFSVYFFISFRFSSHTNVLSTQ